ncbi:endonuclease domain-containing protein [Microbacterium thalassium]|uniref:Very-short-patch-repair endonuclease n=1 Tax=Microbacterium thalassium TaxID=362649 RepID=A0A7X0FQ71_9MICO|nr:DUF559 domain-containing protein [Microbacterium thalassium]MBB6391195.1 very-short-patch-repair endonuclease [Microbacterium thalassium]GLK23695.1 hypothetical protein GCM10017607_10130 [Microbacterium thalassium]
MTQHPLEDPPADPVLALASWVIQSGGIVHRRAAERVGYTVALQRSAVRHGALERVRRDWLATANAPADLRTAAINGASLTCVSLARRRGWWVPETAPVDTHLRIAPHGASPVSDEVTVHWTRRIAPAPGYALTESTEDALSHIAVCLDPEGAQVLWNSAVKIEGIALDALRRVQWPHTRARACAERASDQSDSGLETIACVRLTALGLPVVQQVEIGGRPVDLLIGERLVVQVDGHEFHSSSAQRTKDVAFDAELTLRGYTVLRFTYAQVVHDWDSVERTIARSVASGAHLAR